MSALHHTCSQGLASGLKSKRKPHFTAVKLSWVYQLKKDFSQLKITLNGGVTACNEIVEHLDYVDGVMLGRVVYHQPYILADIDSRVFGNTGIFRTREQVLVDYMSYIKKQLKQGVPIRAMTRHILGLYHGQNNAKFFRRLLSGKTVELGHLDEWLEFIKK